MATVEATIADTLSHCLETLSQASREKCPDRRWVDQKEAWTRFLRARSERFTDSPARANDGLAFPLVHLPPNSSAWRTACPLSRLEPAFQAAHSSRYSTDLTLNGDYLTVIAGFYNASAVGL